MQQKYSVESKTMSQDTLHSGLVEDIKWREAELSSLRIIPYQYNVSDQHKTILLKYSIPAIYSLWEGFVRQAFYLYIRELNGLALKCDEIHKNILAHSLTMQDKLCLENVRNSFKSKCEFVECYQTAISQPVEIPMKLPTRSNINYEVIVELLTRFNLKSLPAKYEKPLDKLLFFRNSFAHGDNSVPVDTATVEEFSQLVLNLMSDTVVIICDGFENGDYRLLK